MSAAPQPSSPQTVQEGSPKRIFFVIGEESGDQLGASLAAALRETFGDRVRFEGLGSEGLKAHGLETLFDIEDIAVMGLGPVLARLPTILARMRQTVDAIIASQPDLVVIIDSPDFTHRVAQRVRKRRPQQSIVGWVSPSVWAWRPKRAIAMCGYMDHLLVLLPFEVEAHKRLGGPPATYVGHPLIAELDSLRPASGERTALTEDVPPTILLLPGSRSGELRRHLPVFKQTLLEVEALCHARKLRQPRYVLPAVTKHAQAVSKELKTWPVSVEMITGKDNKRSAMRQAHAALAASGTVTLELALAGVPSVVLYKLDGLARIFRQLVKVWTVTLPNLILDRPVVREYIDEFARPDTLARALVSFATDTPERRAQVDAFVELDERMAGPDTLTPAQRARQVVEQFL
ncbi:MAG: lipid-A-disaccharide synthase [Pseudomonadota bacterium]